MNINECYQAMGADYEEVFGRLRSERLITKFVLKFPSDPSFSQLQSTLEEKNVEEKASHRTLDSPRSMKPPPLSPKFSAQATCRKMTI